MRASYDISAMIYRYLLQIDPDEADNAPIYRYLHAQTEAGMAAVGVLFLTAPPAPGVTPNHVPGQNAGAHTSHIGIVIRNGAIPEIAPFPHIIRRVVPAWMLCKKWSGSSSS